MKFEQKNLEKSQIEFVFTLEAVELEKFLDEAAKELSKEVKIDGFRSGTVPRKILEQQIGQGKILERAADLAVRKTYYGFIKEKEIEAIGLPEAQVLKMAPGNEFEFKVKVAVMPEVKLPDYRKIAQGEKKKTKDEIKVEEKEVDEAVKWLQKSRTKFAAVGRPVEKGDRVEVDFIAKKDGKIIDGGESKNHPLIIGENKFVPGFEDNLIGMKENETKLFNLKFPENYQVKDLSGQQIDFEVKMNLVQESQVPELTEEFIKTLGNFSTLGDLKKNIREGLVMEKEQKEKEIWRAKVLREIAQKSEIELAESLVKAELEKMTEEFKANVAQMGLDFKVYLENLKKTEDELKKDWAAKAEERVRAALVLREIAKKDVVQVPLEEAQEEVNKLLAHYPDTETVKRQIDIERLMEYTMERLKNEKVFEILEKA